MAVSLSGKVRVNSISPGWIDNENQNYTGQDAYQQPAGRVGIPIFIVECLVVSYWFYRKETILSIVYREQPYFRQKYRKVWKYQFAVHDSQ